MSQSASATSRILCIGEAMLELALNDPPDARVAFAGDTLNTAVYLKRLAGDNLDVSYCTVVGSDALSGRLIEFIQSEEIKVDSIRRSRDRTIGLYAIATDTDGERSFTYWRNESAAKTLFQNGAATDFSMLEQFPVIYLSAITVAILPVMIRDALLLELSRLRREKDTLVAFDSNYRPALWESSSAARSTIEAFWRITDIALPSIDDEQQLFNDSDAQTMIARFQTYGVDRGALKRGATGPLSLGPTVEQNASLHFEQIKAVDSTAAGDSFNAGYLSAILTGESQRTSLLQGHQCASQVIAQQGAIIPKDSWADIVS
jgi:2-dehydro-3-deoxygluconokinase